MEYTKQDLEQVEKEIKAQIKRAQFDFAIWHIFETKVLPSFICKPISKRIATATQKAFPGLYVTYDTNYNMYHINIYQQTKVVGGKRYPDFDKKTSIMLGHKPWGTGDSSASMVDIEKIKSFNTCHEADKGRVEKKKQGLPQAAKWVKKINNLIAQLEDLNVEMCTCDLDYIFTKK